MKQPEDARMRIVHEWINKANADMVVAERLPIKEPVFLNAITFHCQQAAEKYLKALLAYWDIEFPKTHVLAKLIALVETHDSTVAASLLDTIALTPYGVELRYPGDRPDATPDEAHEAVTLARQVRDAVLPLIPSPSADPKGPA